MLDTLRITGKSTHFRFNPSVTKYYSYHRPGSVDRETIEIVQIEKTSTHRTFCDPNRNLVTIECNPHKLMFQNNIWNYEFHPWAIKAIIENVGQYFFGFTDFWVNRLDIGAVHTFSTPSEARRVLEGYRGTRPDSARATRFKNQPYADSVFYSAGKAYSVKIYIKGAEMRHNGESVLGFPFDLDATLRYEKTYRTEGLKRLGMTAQAYYGVHIDNLDMPAVMEDFFNYFSRWTSSSKPYQTEMRNSMGLLNVIDNLGQLSNVEASAPVSRQTIYRYKKAKRNAVCNDPDFNVKFVNNSTPEIIALHNSFFTFGLHSLFIH